jgi:3-oxoadipate enol-lactonase
VAVELVRKVRVDDTLEMGYYLDDCTDPWKTPATVVLMHGVRKPRQQFYAWIPTLARRFQVIRPHLRGHWDSTPAPEDYEWTVDGLVRDLVNFIDALGVGKVHYVGESLGGLLGYFLAHDYPDRLHTLTLVTAPGPSFKQNKNAKSTMEQRHPVWGADEKARAQLLAEFGPENRELAEWAYAERWKNSVEATKGYFNAGRNCEVNTAQFLSQIAVPTMYMTGAECTRLIPLEEAHEICRLIPNAKLVTFPGIKAQCQYVIPEKCAAEVVRFIDEQHRGIG